MNHRVVWIWVVQGCKHVRSGSTKYLGTLEKRATGKEISLKSLRKIRWLLNFRMPTSHRKFRNDDQMTIRWNKILGRNLGTCSLRGCPLLCKMTLNFPLHVNFWKCKLEFLVEWKAHAEMRRVFEMHEQRWQQYASWYWMVVIGRTALTNARY